MTSKKTRSTGAQLRALVDYMATHKSFANGEYTGPLGASKHQAQWTSLKEILKEIGPDKSVEQWKHTWRDLKKKSRKENAVMRNTKTGNNTTIPELSKTSIKILSIIGQESLIGIGPAESPIGDTSEMPNSDAYFQVLPPPPSFSNIEPSQSLPDLNPQPSSPNPAIPVLSPTLPELMVTPVNNENMPTQSQLRHGINRSEVPETCISLQRENNILLKELCTLLSENNKLKEEQNSIMREQNRILKRKIHKKYFKQK